jgi:fibronectin-binding autotransporter adhesin
MKAVITACHSAANAARSLTMKKVQTEESSRSIMKLRSRRIFRKTRLRPGLEGLETRLALSTFKVNTLLDTVAVDLRSGKDAAGHISLRSAIQAANSRSNSDTIQLPSGTIKLTLAGANEDNAATGDLDLKSTVTIKGKGAGSTIIDADNLDRGSRSSVARFRSPA